MCICKFAYIFKNLCATKKFRVFEKGHHANERIVSYICSLNEADKLKNKLAKN